MLKFVMTAVLIAAGSIALAQDGPSYEQTVGFIQQKINTITTMGGKTFRNSFIELERCEFAYLNFSGASSLGVTVHDFSNSDPTKVNLFETGNFSISVGTFENKNSVQLIELHSKAYYLNNGWSVPSDLNERHCDSEIHRRVFGQPEVSNLIQISHGDRTCSSTRRVSHMRIGSILSPARENAPRIQRAFQHLVRLCGGREELF